MFLSIWCGIWHAFAKLSLFHWDPVMSFYRKTLFQVSCSGCLWWFQFVCFRSISYEKEECFGVWQCAHLTGMGSLPIASLCFPWADLEECLLFLCSNLVCIFCRYINKTCKCSMDRMGTESLELWENEETLNIQWKTSGFQKIYIYIQHMINSLAENHVHILCKGKT